MSRSQPRPHTPKLVILLLVLSLFLVACERPLTEDGDVDVEVTVIPTEDPDVGGGTDAEPAPTVEEQEAEELPATAEPAVEEEEQEEGSAIPSDDPEEAITPETVEEAPEEIIEEAVEETEEAVEEVEEAAEEMEEAVVEATEEAPAAEAEPGESGGTEGDSEVGGGVADTDVETEAEEMAEATEAEAEEMEETAETEAEEMEETAETEGEAAQLPTTEQVHVVQPGENLFRIGLQYGVSWTVLANYNNLANPYRIYAGQTLRIPPADDTGTPAPEETTYVVRRGDNLYRISRVFNVSWPEIAEANDLQPPYIVYPGQELTIPGTGQ